MLKDPRHIEISDYDYSLPEELVANFPLENREDSRLLIYKNEAITEDLYRNIARHLPSESKMYFNNTKVIGARLLFTKLSGGIIEIFLLNPTDPSVHQAAALAQKSPVQWNCLIGGASKWKPGLILTKQIFINSREITLSAGFIRKNEEDFTVQLSWTNEEFSLSEILEQAGNIPLPPYIRRKPEEQDRFRYQTTYSEIAGSVAAPTAGLHFTAEVLNTIKETGITIDFLTLHVGAGTFKPVKAELLEGHEMHSERFEVSRKMISEMISGKDKPRIAVGTTSLRTLESLYWIGNLICQQPEIRSEDLYISQWHPYETHHCASPEVALHALEQYMIKNEMNHLTASTGILIAPGYNFKMTDILVTNFHQPKSTLLLLISAFTGEAWHNIYDYALKNKFRFLSYGDGCLLFRS